MPGPGTVSRSSIGRGCLDLALDAFDVAGADHGDDGLTGRFADLHREVAVALVDQRLLGLGELARQRLERVGELRFLLELLDVLGVDLLGDEERGEQARERLDLGPGAEPRGGSLERDLDAAIGEHELSTGSRAHSMAATISAPGLTPSWLAMRRWNARHDQRAEQEVRLAFAQHREDVELAPRVRVGEALVARLAELDAHRVGSHAIDGGAHVLDRAGRDVGGADQEDALARHLEEMDGARQLERGGGVGSGHRRAGHGRARGRRREPGLDRCAAMVPNIGSPQSVRPQADRVSSPNLLERMDLRVCYAVPFGAARGWQAWVRLAQL